MDLRSSLTATFVVLWIQCSPALAVDLKYPHMHHAIHELREARKELKEAAHDFGGHREQALLACDAAIKQIEVALKSEGDEYKGGKPGKEVYKSYSYHPHIHHAIHELKE